MTAASTPRTSGSRSTPGPRGPVLALSGGVGGAKLAVGLSRVLSPGELTIVCNTGDDFEHLGLHISPDLDSVMYALAGKSDEERGWGRADEGWRFLEAVAELGGDDWFRLGDRDLATHVLRTRELSRGGSLSQATGRLCAALGIEHRVLPMSDQPVRTIVESDAGDLAFQHYFVRDRCQPEVRGFRFQGIEQAPPTPPLLAGLTDPKTSAIVICPSNPFVSIEPILQLSGVEEALRAATALRVAVSPIVAGRALKGPAAKMMRELGMPVDALEVARYYARRELIDRIVIDTLDEALVEPIQALGIEAIATQTVMRTLEDRTLLAGVCLGQI